MSKHKTVICFFSIITFVVICITNLAAQENKSVQDTIMDFYKTKEYETAPELLEAFFNEGDTLDEDASWYYPTVFFFSKIFPSENALNRLMSIYDKIDNEKKRFLILVIGLKNKQLLKKIYEKENDAFLKGFIAAVINDETGYDPLKSNITNATELDVLWSFFLQREKRLLSEKLLPYWHGKISLKIRLKNSKGIQNKSKNLKSFFPISTSNIKTGSLPLLRPTAIFPCWKNIKNAPKVLESCFRFCRYPRMNYIVQA